MARSHSLISAAALDSSPVICRRDRLGWISTPATSNGWPATPRMSRVWWPRPRPCLFPTVRFEPRFAPRSSNTFPIRPLCFRRSAACSLRVDCSSVLPPVVPPSGDSAGCLSPAGGKRRSHFIANTPGTNCWRFLSVGSRSLSLSPPWDRAGRLLLKGYEIQPLEISYPLRRRPGGDGGALLGECHCPPRLL